MELRSQARVESSADRTRTRYVAIPIHFHFRQKIVVISSQGHVPRQGDSTEGVPELVQDLRVEAAFSSPTSVMGEAYGENTVDRVRQIADYGRPPPFAGRRRPGAVELAVGCGKTADRGVGETFEMRPRVLPIRLAQRGCCTAILKAAV